MKRAGRAGATRKKLVRATRHRAGDPRYAVVGPLAFRAEYSVRYGRRPVHRGEFEIAKEALAWPED